MLSLVENLLEISPTISSGDRRPFLTETVKADDAAKFGRGPAQPETLFVGNMIAFILSLVGPKGLEFARYSLDYHTTRNYFARKPQMGKKSQQSHAIICQKDSGNVQQKRWSNRSNALQEMNIVSLSHRMKKAWFSFTHSSPHFTYTKLDTHKCSLFCWFIDFACGVSDLN